MKNFLQLLWACYSILGMIVAPVIITVAPLVPYILTNNPWWLALMIITFPVGITVSMTFQKAN